MGCAMAGVLRRRRRRHRGGGGGRSARRRDRRAHAPLALDARGTRALFAARSGERGEGGGWAAARPLEVVLQKKRTTQSPFDDSVACGVPRLRARARPTNDSPRAARGMRRACIMWGDGCCAAGRVPVRARKAGRRDGWAGRERDGCGFGGRRGSGLGVFLNVKRGTGRCVRCVRERRWCV